jgi:hypothetical protein
MQHHEQPETTLTQSPRNVFLLDGFGAILTAAMHGVVLTRYQSIFGMPETVLLPLAAIACCFAVFSFTNAFRMPSNWRLNLLGIAIANLCFCAVSIGFVCYYSASISILGFIYFAAEVVVVVVLASWEIQMARRPRS